MLISATLAGEAGEIERFAASELRRYVQLLFGGQSDDGRPAARPRDEWRFHLIVDPSLDSQEFALQPTGERGLHLVGGSGAAVLWAVYELVERWGVTYLLHGDVLPESPGPLRLPDSVVQMKPRLRTRAWRTISTHAFGPESWPLSEYERFIDQCAKLKFNHLHFSVWPWQPFVDYSFRGVRKSSALTKLGMRLPLPRDMVGRELFGDAEEFENPDLRGLMRYEDRVAAGQKLMRAIMARGKARGMSSSIAAQVTEWPKEFQRFFPDSTEIRQAGALTFGRAAGQPPNDPAMVELARASLHGHVDAYPDAELVYLGSQEHRDQVDYYEWCFGQLDTKYHLSEIRPLDETLRLASTRTTVLGGAAREISRVKGDVVALYFLDRVVADPTVLERTGAPPIEIGYVDFADEVICYLGRLQPPARATLNFIDYTAGKVLEQREVLDLVPTEPPANLTFTLADDNVGILPQLTTRALVELSEEIIRRGWNGFSTRYWMIGDLDPTAAAISRVAWDSRVTARLTTSTQLDRVCGHAASAPMTEALALVEHITHALDSHGIGFGFPVEKLMMKHWDGKPLGSEFLQDRVSYARALGLAQDALAMTRSAGADYVRYFIGRLAFAVHYLDCVELVHESSVADVPGRGMEAIALTGEALDRLSQAIESWASVARDHSDLGAIASIYELAYQPLRSHLARLQTRG